MLIVPIQGRPDWSRPPLITLALICVNVLVFLLYQSPDNDKLALAGDVYQDYQLGVAELPLYRDYHAEQFPLDAPVDIEAQELVNYVLFDRAFDAYLQERWEQGAIDVQTFPQWRQHRLEFESLRNRASSIAAGLTPAESKPITFLTSMFLHGGWEHLIGNMVFLFLFGFTLEMALRPWVFLGMYLVSGVSADLLFIAFNSNSWVPLVGASGAISGLMGMYLALYRLRTIRFFYAIFFYFGEFKAPALWVFPLWIGKELYGHFFVESNTAYWAHVGGLLAGAGLMLLLPSARQEFSQKEEEAEQGDDLQRKLGEVKAARAQLDFDKARRRVRLLCQQYPDSPEPWMLNFQLYKLQPAQRVFHEQTLAFVRRFVAQPSPSQEWVERAGELLHEYKQLSPKTPALTAKASLAIANAYKRAGQTSVARQWLDFANAKGQNPRMLT
ncbi:rhomboid family intramembrane serine protease [Gilvimarinus sp. SDUM040013]|uniref:Rhomboid family intramembrane serine protease n=1 Tax=Gilvimarinus gilvus TaxID=3058038 RepID=A0ABU4RT83_9GAMM|nr:rhomboid family intramembrane serine protease [Gilvimarinus sp. SDUM040013]MDO3387008.1 rhomboid family intramembrane serine protease [Gilvimarinus sp. SDUM040013]MDX6848098.1 rhomboid family intramembrane serine protease [Gilvimarinus sp. SDUM040013]